MLDIEQQLAALFVEAGHAHHDAYIKTNGLDPEWPLWYADYIQERLTNWLNVRFTKSELVYLLVKADKELHANGATVAWPEYYARLFREYAEMQSS